MASLPSKATTRFGTSHAGAQGGSPVLRRWGVVKMRWLSAFNLVEWAFLIFSAGMMAAGVLFITEIVFSLVSRLCAAVSLFGVCAVPRRRSPVGASPIRQTLQPEATGAAMEVTKWLKPLVSVSRYTVTARVCRP